MCGRSVSRNGGFRGNGGGGGGVDLTGVGVCGVSQCSGIDDGGDFLVVLLLLIIILNRCSCRG